jgi:hypothetical protein
MKRKPGIASVFRDKIISLRNFIPSRSSEREQTVEPRGVELPKRRQLEKHHAQFPAQRSGMLKEACDVLLGFREFFHVCMRFRVPPASLTPSEFSRRYQGRKSRRIGESTTTKPLATMILPIIYQSCPPCPFALSLIGLVLLIIQTRSRQNCTNLSPLLKNTA